MTAAHDSSRTPAQPALAELFAQYLQRQVAAHEAGVGFAEAGEVVPFEAVPAQPVDPRVAWNEAVAVVPYFHSTAKAKSWQALPEWPNLVGAREPVVALAFCLGNFPQLVRNVHPLLHAPALAALRAPAPGCVPAPALLEWAGRRRFPEALLAVGALRLAKQFDAAAELLRQRQAEVPAEWRAAWANEEAALAWHRGRGEEALASWQQQADGVPVLFNRGMAALFLDRPAEARAPLSQAAARLPEQSGWHHLARLYLALAEAR